MVNIGKKKFSVETLEAFFRGYDLNCKISVKDTSFDQKMAKFDDIKTAVKRLNGKVLQSKSKNVMNCINTIIIIDDITYSTNFWSNSNWILAGYSESTPVVDILEYGWEIVE